MRIVNNILGPLFCDPGDKVYIISDLHLGHKKEFLWGRRSELYQKYVDKNIQFNDEKEYSQYILSELKQLAENSGPDSYLISLGDISLNDENSFYIEEFSKLPFTKIYTLKGNHSSGLNSLVNKDNNLLPYFNNLVLIDSCIHLRVKKNKNFILSHFPIYSWDALSKGCLCGHCHGFYPELNENNSSLGRIFDCGVDNALRLFGRCYFTLKEVLTIIYNKEDANSHELERRVSN